MQYKFDCGCSFKVKDTDEVARQKIQAGLIPKIHFDIMNINKDCQAVWQMLGQGLTKGVFQLESPLGKQWTKKLKPTSLKHLAALGSILRPGCLRSIDEKNNCSLTELYCRRKNLEAEIEYLHPALEPILNESYAVLIFQEQAMAIAQAIAGFSLQDADVLRKACGKKLPEEMAKVKVMFLEGAKKTNVVSVEQAAEIFSWIEKSQRYSFNRCISKNTILRKLHVGKFDCVLTVGEMYAIRNCIEYAKDSGHLSLYKKWKLYGNYRNSSLSMADDKRVRPNIVKDIYYSGEAPIFRVITSSGKSIEVTINHKFPTECGDKQLSELVVGDKLYICGQYEITDFTKINKFSKLTKKDLRKQHKSCLGHCGFMTSENNPGYTNGSYTEFKNNKEILPLGCEICGKTTGRIETHHKDKNRENSKLENLIRLCAGCHKKEDYKLGRTKVGEKGYPTHLEEIVDIVYIGIEEVYDIEMESPNHNFVVESGIITCNSHAASYGLISYWTAYQKAHTEVQFFSNWLKFAKEKQDPLTEICELVNEARAMDVVVTTPKFVDMRTHFYNDGKKVYFGLSDVKGIGENLVVKVRKTVEESEAFLNKKVKDFTFYEFLVHCSDGLSKTVVEHLIEVGGMAHFGLPRSYMLHSYRRWNELTEKEKDFVQHSTFSCLIDAVKAAIPIKRNGGAAHTEKRSNVLKGVVDSLENPMTKLEDTPNWIAATEKMYMGIAITCDSTDACDMSEVNCSCKDYLAGKTGYLMLGASIQSFRVVKVKKGDSAGKEMAFLTISDGTCALNDVCMFPAVWEEFSHLIYDGATVMIQGDRDKKNNSLIVKKVFILE